MSYLSRGIGAVGAVAQGVGGFVFGKGESGSSHDDGGVEVLLERISNGVLADDRRAAIGELRDVVAENPSAQLALGAMGFPILTSILKDEGDDIELVRGALETLINGLLVSGLASNSHTGDLVPGRINAELFAREQGAVQLLLRMLEEEDFYIRYHTVQLLTLLLQSCPDRLQEAILGSPLGVAKLMDMLVEREVIRNEALLLLTSLTRANTEIQKIVAFEGAFERLFNIIREEGNADGGIIVQDTLELLNNLLRNNPSNQVLLRETVGLHHIPPLLRLRRGNSDGLSRQKAANLLCALETVSLLVGRTANMPAGQEANIAANQGALCQNKIMDVLLALAVEGRISSIPVRAQALRSIGAVVRGHGANQVALGSAMVGERQDEPALHAVLRIALKAAHTTERIAADFVFKCFCENNADGQMMLASTITPLPQTTGRTAGDEAVTSFGNLLVRGLCSEGRMDLEASCRAASVLCHLLDNNSGVKERVLKIPLEMSSSSAAPPDLLLSRCMRWLSSLAINATAAPSNSSATTSTHWLQPVLLRLLITWLYDCPPACTAFLTSAAHLALVVDLLSCSTPAVAVHVSGLAAVLLGVCLVFTDKTRTRASSSASPHTVLDIISQRAGLPSYFAKWEDMRRTPLWLTAASAPKMAVPLTRVTASKVLNAEDASPPSVWPPQQARDGWEMEQQHAGLEAESGMPASSTLSSEHDLNPELATFYDPEFVALVVDLEGQVRKAAIALYGRPRGESGAVSAAELEARPGESEQQLLARLRQMVWDQAQELADVRESNAGLAAELMAATAGGGGSGGAAGTSQSSSAEGEGTKASSGDNEGTGPVLPVSRRSGVQGPGDIARVRAETDSLRKQCAELQRQLASEQSKQQAVLAEVERQKAIAAKNESDLGHLSAAYNTLEAENFRFEGELKRLQHGNQEGEAVPDENTTTSEEALAAARAEGRAEAEKESESELNDLLVCLGQEEAKVSKLREVLEGLGHDVDALLEGIGEGEGDDGEEEGEEEEDEDDTDR